MYDVTDNWFTHLVPKFFLINDSSGKRVVFSVQLTNLLSMGDCLTSRYLDDNLLTFLCSQIMGNAFKPEFEKYNIGKFSYIHNNTSCSFVLIVKSKWKNFIGYSKPTLRTLFSKRWYEKKNNNTFFNILPIWNLTFLAR